MYPPPLKAGIRRAATSGPLVFNGATSQSKGNGAVPYTEYRMQVVTLDITSARSTPSTVGVFAVASNHQRLAVDDIHPTSLPQMNQMLW
jgi:hypothetical protein